MLSGSLLRFRVIAGRVEPGTIDERYAPLIRELLVRYEAARGRPWRRLEESAAGIAALDLHDRRLTAGLRRVIEEGMALETAAPLEPARAREAVFLLSGRRPDLTPGEILRQAAAELGLPEGEIPDLLHADLRPNRIVRFEDPLPSVAEVISRYNFRLVQGLLLRAERLSVRTEGNVRAIYRFAKLHGLLVEVEEAPRAGLEGEMRLGITGPLSLFGRTRRYGLAMARFLPACCAGARYRLEAFLRIDGAAARLEITAADRVLPSHSLPRHFDSKVEARFFLDFLRLEAGWEIAREAEIIPLNGGRAVFIPDFTLRRRSRPDQAVHLEVIGFWTKDYLARKREIIGKLAAAPIILCIDERLGDDPMGPAGAGAPLAVIRYRRRVPARAVLDLIERLAPAGG